MKLVSLNVDKGANCDPLLKFLSSKKDEVDIFCFQEVIDGGEKELKTFWDDGKEKVWNLLSLLQETLPEHTSFFRPHIGDWAGLAIFVRKSISVKREGDVFVFKNSRVYPCSLEWNPPAPRNIQYMEIPFKDRTLTVINFHGLWDNGQKEDTENRIAQSQKIIDFAKSCTGEIILCGDFNLSPNTKSMHMLEQELHLQNLIHKYNIVSTRTSLYTDSPNKFADYVLTTAGVEIRNFKVLPDEVSDHAPLFLEFD